VIFGSYPCCDGALTLSIPDDLETPLIQREICPHCGALVWHKLSRFDPESWTDDGFRALYDVNDETKAVTLKNPPAPMSPAEQEIMDKISQKLADQIAEEMFSRGDGGPGFLRGVL
jgi:hypothetical protein